MAGDPERDGSRRVVRHGRASTTRSIARSIVIKRDDLFFLCEPSGDVPLEGDHGLGLYYHDCRYLNGYTFRLGQARPEVLGADGGAGFWATFEFTNPDFSVDNGPLLQKETLGIRWDRTVDAAQTSLHDVIAVSNYGFEEVGIPVEITVRSQFESLFHVRGAQPKARGRLHAPEWIGGMLSFRYDGADGLQRMLEVRFDPVPAGTQQTTASFRFRIPPRETVKLAVSCRALEVPRGRSAAVRRMPSYDQATARGDLKRASDEWVARATRVESDSQLLNGSIDRSLRDLHVLGSSLHGYRYFAAGVPWYVTLFGRDSLTAALETLAFVPWMAADTIRLLATLQGTRDDDGRDEQPGKIPHELRVGEMARLHEIPQTPYYGSVDATPLFLILLARHAIWTGSLDLFKEMSPSVEAARRWLDREMAASGLLSYATAASHGLSNQGWKDSGDAISNADGTLATPPIALIEVQGYVYLAWTTLARLYDRSGDPETARRLVSDAAALRHRVNGTFWSDRLGTYAIAIEGNGRRADIVSSNPGQALWTGIATPEYARRTVERLLRPDMFSGWGIRTLATGERRFNPIGYHLGTVWPHDNALAAAGFRRYGFADEAARVFAGILDAASCFEHQRLPEVFAGFDRREHRTVVRYPVACHPQAWAAGSIPFMLESSLGLEPDAFAHRLGIRAPTLPQFVNRLMLDRLPVGDATARLVFRRDGTRVVLEDAVATGTLRIELLPSE